MAVVREVVNRVAFPAVLLVGAISAFFIDLFPVHTVYADRRFVLVGGLALCLPLLIYYACRQNPKHLDATIYWVAAGTAVFIGVAWITWLATGAHAFAVTEVFLYSAYLLAIGLAGQWLSANAQQPWRLQPAHIAQVLAACILAYGLMTLPVYLFMLNDQFHKLSAILPWGFINIRYWSHLASWTLPLMPLAVLVGPWKHQRLWRFGMALGAALTWWIVFLSTARGSILAVATGTLIVAGLFGRQARPYLTIALRYCFCGGIAWLLLSVVVPSIVFGDIQIRQLSTDSSGRMPLWLEAFRMSQQHFPFGMGPQSWITHAIITPAYEASPKYGHPHNMYLMWAAEYGWLAVAGLLLIAAATVKRLWQVRQQLSTLSPQKALPLMGLLAATMAGLVHASFSAVFMAPASMLVGFFVLAAFWGQLQYMVRSTQSVGSTEALPERPRLPRWAALLIAGACLVASCLWGFSVANYYSAARADAIANPRQMTPRFWVYGDFPRRSTKPASQ